MYVNKKLSLLVKININIKGENLFTNLRRIVSSIIQLYFLIPRNIYKMYFSLKSKLTIANGLL